MPCEIASFNANEKYDMTLFFVNFYICLIIIITVLIFVNTLYNYYVYNNILLERIYDDIKVIENRDYPPIGDEVQQDNKILIGETVDYKLFISLLLDENMYYNDKYFTLNITNIFLDVFMLITIVLVLLSSIYIALSSIKNICKAFSLKFDFKELTKYIKQYCYLINNKSCDDYSVLKIGLIAIVFIILIAIYSLRRDIIPSIKYYSEYLDFNISKDEDKKGPKNIENMLNIICDTKDDFLNNNDNINKILNKLNGHNIHTVDTVSASIVTKTALDTAKTAAESAKTAAESAKTDLDKAKTYSDQTAIKKAQTDYDAKKLDYDNKKQAYDNSAIDYFINKIKEISIIIKGVKGDKDNKDLDFVKLVIVYLNNKKIYNDNNNIPNKITTDLAKTYAQSLLNIITNVIPFNLFGSFKTKNYDIENILIGAIPLSQKDRIINDAANCEIGYKNETDLNKIKEVKGCFYNNYVFKLKETATKLRYALLVILVLAIISIIFIMTLFYYIYINYNYYNMKWANMTAIKMMRLSYWNPLNWLSMLLGYIMFGLNSVNN
jgi:hypothetical protein